MAIFALFLVFFVFVQFYSVCKAINSLITNDKNYKEKVFILDNPSMEIMFTVFTILECLIGFGINYSSLNPGEVLRIHNSEIMIPYTPLAFKHIPTILTFLALGLFAYVMLKLFSEDLPPIPYVLCCSMLIINIILMVVYLIQVSTYGDYIWNISMIGINLIGFSFFYFIFIYIATLKSSMDIVRRREKNLNKEYKNKYFNKIYIFFVKYNSKPIVWVIALFPVLIIVQLILVLFGQQPDSFIKVFFETSSYTYSKITSPDPVVTYGDSHYLCTVSAHGHKKIVKPLRSGIRRNKRILVNRQLLVANAFENILEQYTPKFHKAIRYIYDKYGYPLSKHINTKITADLVYFVMKPLEWVFLIVLYSVDKNPENRINIQYSELRKN